MKKAALGLTGATILILMAGCASEEIHWGYFGHSGPEHWGNLDKSFAACSGGKNQSPINIMGVVEADLEPVKFYYQSNPTEILNNGHTIQVNYQPGSTMILEGSEFELKQFHFHAPSENIVNGQAFPMEAHLVHADKEGNLAVVGVMLEVGSYNPVIGKLWMKLPHRSGEKNRIDTDINAVNLLPKDKSYYRFNGSLTTPPCTEGVRWLVMKQAAPVSKAQVESFMHVMHHANNRPIQHVNARTVLQ